MSFKIEIAFIACVTRLWNSATCLNIPALEDSQLGVSIFVKKNTVDFL